VRALKPREGRAQESEEVAPLWVTPDEPERREQSVAERGLRESEPALEGERNAKRSEGRLQRGPPRFERRHDNGDLLGLRPAPEKREDLLADQLEAAAGSRAFQESNRPFERGRVG
jgi:hypothetical protein